MKSVFIHIEIRTNYRNKSLALRLSLKERLRGTRKWPIMLEWICHQRFVKKTKTKYLVKSRAPCNFKTGNLKSLIGRERPRNVLPWKKHVQSVRNYLFSKLNMQSDDVLVSLAVMVTEAPYSHFHVGLHWDLKDPCSYF